MKKFATLILSGALLLAFSACTPKDQPADTTTEKPTESITEETAAASADTSASGDRWVDSKHFYLNSKEINLGIEGSTSTLQDVADAGCYFVIWDLPVSSTEREYYTLDDEYKTIMTVWIYPDEASASSETGRITLYVADLSSPCLLKDCTVFGITSTADDISVWGDKVSFDFPLAMTPEQLIENSGEPASVEDNEYMYMSGESGRNWWRFEFDENDQLTSLSWH